MAYNEWVVEACKRRGIQVNADGSLDVCFFGDNVAHVPDLDTAIRQQQHIIDQQKVEQKENEEIGKLMGTFHDTVVSMSSMTIAELTIEKLSDFKTELLGVLEVMSKKREDLRKDGYERLTKVFKMVEKKNLPAANTASQAALARMRKRWLVNEKVIDKSLARLEALKQLKN
jgi:DNA-binding GntR family transcriptional regulator